MKMIKDRQTSGRIFPALQIAKVSIATAHTHTHHTATPSSPMASSSRTSPLYPPPAILPLATLQSSLGSFAGYLAPDPSELRTTFGCTHLGNSAETLTHLSSLSTQLKIEEENDSTLKPVNKSNMYSYHSQVYKRNKEPATPSGEIATQIAENVVDKLVSELFSWSGKRKQYKPAEYWINIMSVGDNDVERSSASISSIDLLPPSTFLSQILTITSTSPPPPPP